MKSNLLATKLYRPAPTPKRVRRAQLLERLNEGLAVGRSLTLVSAPAGFGKTTCISEWVEGLGLPVAWLSLEAADDDPGRFFTYLVAALQRVDENLGRDIESVLQGGQLPPVEGISAALINDILEREERFLLVLDDFQVIQDRAILQVMSMLMANQPPQLHLVLVTREDPELPLHRLRANNQMTEVRANDLRFQDSEAGAFLNGVLGLSLAEADVTALEERTEGWIVGLQLAGLSVRGRADPSSFIATLSGSHRYILGYLTEEVLGRQPVEIQDFLLQTSILDKLSGDLCDAVAGRTGSRELLERLYSANLFLVSLDDEQQWYRYHHLFVDLLRSQQLKLPREQVAELHRRASRWYAGAGQPGEAIEHALAAQDFPLAARLLERHAMSILLQGYVKTVEGWMRALPPEMDWQSPRANLAFAWMHLLRGSYAMAAPHIERVRAAVERPDGLAHLDPAARASLMAEWLALQSGLLNVQGKGAESVQVANHALEIAGPADRYVLSLVTTGLAGAYRQLGDYPRAVEAYQATIRHSRAAGNPVSEALAVANLALLAIQHGELRFAVEIAAQGIEGMERAGSLPPILGAVFGALGLVNYEWNRVEPAREHLQRALQLSTLGGHNAAIVYCLSVVSRVRQGTGDLAGAARAIQEAVDLLRQGVPAWVKPEVAAQQVRVALAQGRALVAESALAEAGLPVQSLLAGEGRLPEINHPSGLLLNAALRLLLDRARGDVETLRRGIDLAGQVIDGARAGQYVLIEVEALLLRSKLYEALGEREASLDDLARAVEITAPEGFLRTFVDEGLAVGITALVQAPRRSLNPAYLQQILAAFPTAAAGGEVAGTNSLASGGAPIVGARFPSPTAPAPVDPLTERELEVLRQMAGGLKYEEIAGKLYITVNTVRFYVKEIYSKLNVNNRTRAIELARQYGWLS